jgi:hypothetical protein
MEGFVINNNKTSFIYEVKLFSILAHLIVAGVDVLWLNVLKCQHFVFRRFDIIGPEYYWKQFTSIQKFYFRKWFCCNVWTTWRSSDEDECFFFTNFLDSACFGLFLVCFGSIETLKCAVSMLNRNKPLVSNTLVLKLVSAPVSVVLNQN